MRMIKYSLVFIGLALLVGFTTSFFFRPGEWHEALIKPWFNPPNRVFGPVWTTLYIMIGIAGALAWRWDPQSRAIKYWFFQLVLNGAWTMVFFGLHQIELALVVILLLLVAILAFIGRTRKELPSAAWLFAPYLAWVSFAAILNASIASLN